MIPKFHGNPEIQELEPELEFLPSGEVRAVRVWRGPKDAIRGFLPAVRGLGAQGRIIHENELYARMEARFPDAQDGTDPTAATNLTTVWELEGNDLEKDLFNHVNFTSLPDPEEKTALRAFRQEPSDTAEPPEINSSTALAFMQVILKGVESFTVSQFVLRRTTTVPAAYDAQWSTTNVGKKYTTAELTTAESIPATIKFQLPDGEWLKRTPSIRQRPDGRFEIVNEWWHAEEWDSLLYEAAS